MYELIRQEGRAKRARMTTVHGVIETPVFMNVATAGAIKGGLSADDLRTIDTQVALCNTYHLHVRPGDALVHRMGGLHRFMCWDRPILTDSGGFQVFSLSDLRSIKEEGVTFRSHVDGRKIFMGPEDPFGRQDNTLACPLQDRDAASEPAGDYSKPAPAPLRHQSGCDHTGHPDRPRKADFGDGTGRIRNRRTCGR